mmetsp:Transcript_7314/g.23408  ORF Transcript_7314/g.23408 Transcript_7314/m.23408 type:complete len:212 (-) Transcript_7314:186-821(-)
MDPSKLHPLLNPPPPTSSSILTENGEAIGAQGWGDDFTYGTGLFFVGGGAVGATIGGIEGFFFRAPRSSSRIRLNAMLNYGGRRMSKAATGSGAVAVGVLLLARGVDAVRGTDDDPISFVVAGGLLGLAAGCTDTRTLRAMSQRMHTLDAARSLERRRAALPASLTTQPLAGSLARFRGPPFRALTPPLVLAAVGAFCTLPFALARHPATW